MVVERTGKKVEECHLEWHNHRLSTIEYIHLLLGGEELVVNVKSTDADDP